MLSIAQISCQRRSGEVAFITGRTSGQNEVHHDQYLAQRGHHLARKLKFKGSFVVCSQQQFWFREGCVAVQTDGFKCERLGDR